MNDHAIFKCDLSTHQLTHSLSNLQGFPLGDHANTDMIAASMTEATTQMIH